MHPPSLGATVYPSAFGVNLSSLLLLGVNPVIDPVFPSTLSRPIACLYSFSNRKLHVFGGNKQFVSIAVFYWSLLLKKGNKNNVNLFSIKLKRSIFLKVQPVSHQNIKFILPNLQKEKKVCPPRCQKCLGNSLIDITNMQKLFCL